MRFLRWLRGLFRRKPNLPWVYVGPTTSFGLKENSPCSRTGKRTQGNVIEIRTANGKGWVVPDRHVKKAS